MDTSGSAGSAAVRNRLTLAGRTSGYGGIFGLIDGDGEHLAALATRFDAPFQGPCFHWKAYCIENLLAKTGWPAVWGEAPDWTRVLLDHVPYVALNRLHRQLLSSLRTLRLAKFVMPRREEPLLTVEDVVAALAQDKHLLLGYDAETRFVHEATAIQAAIRASLDEGHALVNGKWLVDIFAPRILGGRWSNQRCREEWIAHAVAAGGLAEVRGMWQRITGRTP